MFRFLIAILVSVAVIGAAAAAVRADVTVSAAISLQKVLVASQADLEKAAGDKISFTFGASGTLAGQIREGAPIDLFISADRANVDKLVESENADKGTVMVVATNQLVIIEPKGGPAIGSAADLKGDAVKRVAIGEPKVVPAGEYARQSLVALKLWDDLDKAKKIVTAENVAQVLTLVERGEVEAGFVYRTDALAARNSKIAVEIDASLHAPVEYVSAVVTGSTHAEAAGKLQQALLGKPFTDALEKAGFSPPGAGTRAATKPE